MTSLKYVLIALAVGAAGTVAAETGGSTENCQAIEADDARLRCYDRAASGASSAYESAVVADPVSSQTGPVNPEAPGTAPEIVSAPAVADSTVYEPNQPSIPEPVVSNEPTPEELFGMSSDSLQEVVSEATGVKVAKELTSTIRRISPIGNRKYVFYLDNGQAWIKTGGGSGIIRLDVGDEVVIRKAALGSYALRKLGRNASIKVRRVPDYE